MFLVDSFVEKEQTFMIPTALCNNLLTRGKGSAE